MADSGYRAGDGRNVPPQSLAEHSRQIDGRLVLVRYCGYCWAEYLEPKRHKAYFCSVECSKRNAAWNTWVRATNEAAVGGDVNLPAKAGPALPPAGASLAAAVSRFQLVFEGVEVAA